MKTTLINKNELGIVSRRILKYPLHAAEKDYFLTLALKTIFSSNLRNRVVFKGGTALHHQYLSQYRFSEDLDFTSTDQNVSVKELVNVLESEECFKVKKTYSSPITAKIEKLQYSGVLDTPSSLKIDVSNVKNLVSKPRKQEYKNAWNLKFTVFVMDILETCAEKISATSGRVRYRDFYDLFLIVNELGVEINDAIELLKSKDRENEVSSSLMLENWQNAKKEKQSDLMSIFIKRDVNDYEIETFIKGLNFKRIPSNHKYI